jgi:hypothetical protein
LTIGLTDGIEVGEDESTAPSAPVPNPYWHGRFALHLGDGVRRRGTTGGLEVEDHERHRVERRAQLVERGLHTCPS